MTTTDLIPLLTATFGANLGPSADWISDAFLVFAEPDGKGAWYLVDTEEEGDVLSLGYRAEAEGSSFETETVIPFAEVAEWVADYLPAFLAKCRLVSRTSTPTHTPGPWTVTEGLDIRTQDGMRHLCDASVGETLADYRLLPLTEREANARLIAAAPDLLAELKECRRRLATLRVYDCAVFDQQPHGTLRSVSYDEKLADLVAKAEGRS